MAVADLGETLHALGDGSDEPAQQEAACLLRELVEAEHRVLSNEQFVKFMNEVYEGIFVLVSSADTRRVRGGVLAIRELIEISYEENEVKVIRFANYIRIVFQQPEERVDVHTLVLAALSLGALARAGGPLTVDFVEFEAKRAFEWLLAASELDDASFASAKSDNPSRFAILGPFPPSNRKSRKRGPPALLRRRKLAAILVLRELAINSPVLFMPHVSTVLDHIRTSLHDDRELTRTAAMLTLRASLELILLRDSHLSVQWYYKIFEIARLGFAQGTAATIHGSLLTLGELLNHSGRFMIPRFAECCDTILHYRDYKRDALVRRTVIRLLPELACFCPDAFVRNYLDTCIQHIFSAVERKTERDAAFVALGKLAIAVTYHILPHLPEIMLRVREGLSRDAPAAPRSSRDTSRQPGALSDGTAQSEAAARVALGIDDLPADGTRRHYEAPLACVSMLSQAVGPALLEHNMANGLLGEMFGNGLSAALIDAVADLQRRIPSLRDLILSHLLHSLSYTLSGCPFRAPPGGGVLNNTTFTHLDMLEALEVRIPRARSEFQYRAAGAVPHAISFSGSTLGEDDALARLKWPEEQTPAQASIHSASFFLYFAGGVQRRAAGSGAPPGAAAPVADPSAVNAPLPTYHYQHFSHPSHPHQSGFHTDGAQPAANTAGSLGLSSSGGDFGAFVSGRGRSLSQRRLILLALQTLRKFNFESVNLLPFLHNSVIPYMDDSDPVIRKEVALTCGVLLVPYSASFEATSRLANWGVSAKLTSQGIRRLLMLGVSDPEPAIRAAVLTCLKENDRFDNFLMHEDTLQALFVALHDEDFYVRRIGMAVASRLSPRNPAHIYPAVRKCILAAMAQLRFSPTQTQREEGAVILLGDVVAGFNRSRLMKGGASHATPLVSPIIVPLIKILLAKLREARNTMSTAILRTLGEVASMHGVDMHEYMDDLMPLIIDILQDQGSPEKRRWALWTLGQLVRSTGLVITPLLEYPNLLDTLLGVIKGGSAVPWGLREEALKALGALGALDPFETKQRSRSRARRSQRSLGNSASLEDRSTTSTAAGGQRTGDRGTTASSSAASSQSQAHAHAHAEDNLRGSHSDNDLNPLGPKDEFYYPTVAINALVRILQDGTLATHHSMIIQALTQIFRSLGMNAVAFLSQIMPCILQVATSCEQELRKVLFYNISVVVAISKQYIRPYLDDIFGLIHTYWYENLDQVFVLIEEISRALREEFVPYAKSVLPNILAVLEMMRTNNMDPSKVAAGAANKVTFGMQGIGLNLASSAENHFLPGMPVLTQSASEASLRGWPGGSTSSSLTAAVRRSPRGGAADSATGVSPTASLANLGVSAIGGPMAGIAVVAGNPSSRSRTSSPFDAPSSRPGAQVANHRVVATAEQKLSLSKYATPASARRIFKTIEVLGFTLTGYFYLVIPALIELVETESADDEVRIYAVHALGHLSSHAFFADYSLHAMQCLLRLLRKRVNRLLKCQAVDTLCIFALRFPSIFSMFEQTVENTARERYLAKQAVEHLETTLGILRAEMSEGTPDYDASNPGHSSVRDRYLDTLLRAFYGETSSTDPSIPLFDLGSRAGGGGDHAGLAAADDFNGAQKMLHVNENKLQKSWEASERATAEEWKEWTRRLSVELLRESPSPALRACSAVAQVYNPLAKELFNPAFVSCWSSLKEEYQYSLIYSLEVALQSTRTPPETLQMLLDLAEFMEHDDRVLPIGIRDLGNYAQRCHAYAKALHYQEMVFRNLPGACTEGLISINNKLEQPEAAVGILHYVQQLQRRQYQMAFSQPATRRIPEVNMLDFGVAAAALSPQQQFFQSQQQQQQQQQQVTQQQQHHEEQHQEAREQNGAVPAAGSGATVDDRGRRRARISSHSSFGDEDSVASSRGGPRVREDGSSIPPNGNASTEQFDMVDDLVEDGTIKLKETWFEKLGRWEEALESYEDKLKHIDERPEAMLNDEELASTMGKVRCLINLGEYDQLMGLASKIWQRVPNNAALAKMAPMFCQSAWSCGDWASMEGFARYIPERNLDGYMLRAVLALQHNDFARSRQMIDRGRALLGEELGALVGESYNRAYRQIVSVQQFTELDEIYEFKQRVASRAHSPAEIVEMKAKLQTIWSKRVRGCQENVAVWQSILGAHSLVLDPCEDLQTYIKFSTICRKSSRLRICFMTLQRLGVTGVDFSDFEKIDPHTSFAFLKYRWALLKEQSMQSHQDDQLRNSHYMVGGYNSSYRTSFTVVPVEQPRELASPRSIAESTRLRVSEGRSETVGSLERVIRILEARHHSSPLTKDDRKLLVRCYLKLGSWKLAIEDFKLREDLIASTLRIFYAATEMEPENYKAWHAWALMNFRAVELFNRALLSLSPGSPDHLSAASSFVDLASAHDAIQEETDSILMEEDEDEEEEDEEEEAGATSAAADDALKKGEAPSQADAASAAADESEVRDQDATDDALNGDSFEADARGDAETDAIGEAPNQADAASAAADEGEERGESRNASPGTRPESKGHPKENGDGTAPQSYRDDVDSSSSAAEHGAADLPQPPPLAQQEEADARSSKRNPSRFREAGSYSMQAKKARQRKRRARQRALARRRQVLSDKMHQYVVPAINGFFQSIALGQTSSDSRNVLQDILRLLTLWFAHGQRREVELAIQEGFELVSIGTWLDVVPQLIARIHTRTPGIKAALHQLLTTLGEEHPHALVYPLTVAAKSIDPDRQRAAEQILDELRSTPGNATLVDQAQLVSHELIRVAILWHEQWYESINEASYAWFEDSDLERMTEILDSKHQLMHEHYKTDHEHDFIRNYGRDLEDAERSRRYCSNGGQEMGLAQAWETYYNVWRKLYRELQNIKHLDLKKVSPDLLKAHNMQLAVPGTYVAGRPVVRIDSFAPSIRVIVSKQRPRQFTVRGSDGKDYLFLLKGHEDLRQDERVMQLFGLVNRLLAKERETSRYDLSIERFAVIPLSQNVGISEWLPNTDTLHTLIERFRGSRSVLLDIEQRLIKKVAPDYMSLTVIQKVEAFCHALSHTNGGDLGKVLWLKSRNSEIWLDRRTNYTRSLATMSMVGYVLGLGDRHPSNLMLDRTSGKVIHIDFGDCFEVAMLREKVPEKVPFRLTRMLIAAMEVSGVEGNFRYTCESVMRVLRANRDSVMAMLEAFVHDPLINWRLLQNATNTTADSHDASNMSNSTTSTGQSSTMRDGGSVSSSEVSRSAQRDGADATRAGRGNVPPANGPRRRHPSMAMPIDRRHFEEEVNRPRARTEGRITLHESSMHEVGSFTSAGRSRMSYEASIMHMRKKENREALNQRALAVLQRVHDKLTGRDFAVKKRKQPDAGAQVAGRPAGLVSTAGGDEVGEVANGGQGAAEDAKAAAAGKEPAAGKDARPKGKKAKNYDEDEEEMEESPAPVTLQVQRLIVQATSHENLCQAYMGWCSVW